MNMFNWLFNWLFKHKHKPERGDVYNRSYFDGAVTHVDQVVLIARIEKTCWWTVYWDEGDGREAGFIVNPHDWHWAGFKREI